MFTSHSGFRPFHGLGIDVFLTRGSATLHPRLDAFICLAGFCIAVVLLCVMPAAAARSFAAVNGVPQSPGAVVDGTVTDQTGAVVVNAEVLMLNLASGRRLTTRTDSSGKFELANLSPGPYQISVNSEGF